jgi:hypothetical protein
VRGGKKKTEGERRETRKEREKGGRQMGGRGVRISEGGRVNMRLRWEV